jgi:aryl-alcohol dehydrogenase-like predicted oxidoreductase
MRSPKATFAIVILWVTEWLAVCKRVAAIQEDIRQVGADSKYSTADVATLFALNHPAVSTVITGIRTVAQAEMNAAVSSKEPLPAELMTRLRKHLWLRGVWYGGK